MTRVEIIGNQVLLQDLLEMVERVLPAQYYTVMPVMLGKGSKGKASGDGVWPETNFVCLMFVHSEEHTTVLKKICADIKTGNRENALIMFTSDAHIFEEFRAFD